MIKVNWSGYYPNLCFGVWEIKIDDKLLPIPEDKINTDMNTFGSYQSWHFEDWIEVFEDYEDGLFFDEWLLENKEWIDD